MTAARSIERSLIKAPKRIKGFDGLRAISALFVFYEHKVRNNGVGAVGVWTFFALSGYLILGILNRSRRKTELSVTPGARHEAFVDFWRSRALRIFPPYYVTLIFVFAVFRNFSATEFCFYAAYLQNFFIAYTHRWGVITHFWSLAIEQQFYVLAAPALLFTSARHHRAIITGIFCLCVAFLTCSFIFGWSLLTTSMVPLSNLAFMAVGGYIVLSAEDAPLLRVLAHPVTLVLTASALAAAYVTAWTHGTPLDSAPIRFYFAALPFAGSVICFTLARQDGTVVSLLESRLMVWLGKISYGFYVYHYLTPSADVTARLLHLPVEAFPSHRVWVLVQLAVSLLVAHLSWVYLESPFLRLKRHTPQALPVRQPL